MGKNGRQATSKNASLAKLRQRHIREWILGAGSTALRPQVAQHGRRALRGAVAGFDYVGERFEFVEEPVRALSMRSLRQIPWKGFCGLLLALC